MDADWKTTDLCDAHGSELAIAAPLLRSFGGRRRFCGAIATLRCFEDNSLVREWLGEPGGGRVLVVDGGGSMQCALVGDQLAALGVRSGWAGVVVFGWVRDTAVLAATDLGVLAPAAHPLRSAVPASGMSRSRSPASPFVRGGAWLDADEDGLIVAPVVR